MPIPVDVTGDRVPVPATPFPIPLSGVVYLSTTGNDANPGTSSTAPKRTLFGPSGAYAAVPSGGAIVVRGGVYEEGFVNDGGGTTTWWEQLLRYLFGQR